MENTKKVEEGLEKLILKHQLHTPSERIARTFLLYKEELLNLTNEFAGEYLLRLEAALVNFVKETKTSELKKEVKDFLNSQAFRSKLAREMLKAKNNDWIFK